MNSEKKRGVVLVVVLGFVLLSMLAATSFMLISSSEIKMVKRQNNSTKAFYVAKAGIRKALWVISNNLDKIGDNNWLTSQANTNNNLGNKSFNVQITGDTVTKTIISSGTVASINRQIQAQVQNSWLRKIPGAVYSQGMMKLKFDKRDSCAYIDGKTIPGIYSTSKVDVKGGDKEDKGDKGDKEDKGGKGDKEDKGGKGDKEDKEDKGGKEDKGEEAADDEASSIEGNGRVEGTPPILENQVIFKGMEDGVWDAFDINTLREKAKVNGTYFSADETDDEYNNPYNKKGKYTLPLELDDGTTISDGIFFFDAKKGEPLDDDEVKPNNEIRVKLEGTTKKVSGTIVVVGDLTIEDTKDYDFLFDGVILVLDDLKIDDKRHHRRHHYDTNDSDIVIKGAVLSNNIIEKGKKRKKKPTIDIKNATIEYDADAITKASSHWYIVPGSWQEI